MHLLLFSSPRILYVNFDKGSCFTLMTKEEAIHLLRRYREGLCSEEERQSVEEWYASLEENGKLKWTPEEKFLFNEGLFENIVAEITEEKPFRVVRMPMGILWMKIAASVILLGATVFTWVFISHKGKQKQLIDAVSAAPHTNDALPGKTGAILTLSNGTKILLDTTAIGTIAMQGGTSIVNNDGMLTYNTEKDSHSEAYNSVVTPKGRQYKLVLSDGTKVWLNAASSMYYPVSFGDDQRIVEVSGEAYFEVTEQLNARGLKRPFIVRVIRKSENPAEVQVLGTHFNINAYDDEADTKVTLLEGAIQVSKAGTSPVLVHPGQQARLSSKIRIDKRTDLEVVMAWKNGIFHFKNSDVRTVMRQAERWYDIKVAYPKGVPSDTLNGAISRNVKLSEFLEIIRYSDIQATIENDIVEIKPGLTRKNSF